MRKQLKKPNHLIETPLIFTSKSDAFTVSFEDSDYPIATIPDRFRPTMQNMAYAKIFTVSPEMADLLLEIVNDGWNADKSMRGRDILKKAGFTEL